MTLGEFIDKAIRVPFKEKGRDYEGWDCWGCVMMAYKELYEIDLPEYLNYSSTREYKELKKVIESAQPLWDLVEDPQPGDVALFNIAGAPAHIGFLVDKNNVLHAEENVGTVIEPLRGALWKKRLEGVYRLCPMI